MRIPPQQPKRSVRSLFAPRDVTETARQGQGIGDVEAMRQMAVTSVPEILRNLPGTSTPMSALDAAKAAVELDPVGLGIAALGAVPFGRAAGKVGGAIKAARAGRLPQQPAARKALNAALTAERVVSAASEQARRARGKELFPIEVYHGTRRPYAFDEFTPIPGFGEAKDIPAVHVGSKDAASDRLRTVFGKDFEPIYDVPGKGWSPTGDASELEFAASALPLRMRMTKPYLNADGTPFTEQQLDDQVKAFRRAREGATTPEAALHSDQDAAIDITTKNAFRDHLVEQGYDVIPYVNRYEDAGNVSYMVLQPNRLRSQFAKFNPFMLNSPNLMAGLGAVLAGSAANARPRAQERPDG